MASLVPPCVALHFTSRYRFALPVFHQGVEWVECRSGAPPSAGPTPQGRPAMLRARPRRQASCKDTEPVDAAPSSVPRAPTADAVRTCGSHRSGGRRAPPRPCGQWRSVRGPSCWQVAQTRALLQLCASATMWIEGLAAALRLASVFSCSNLQRLCLLLLCACF